MTFSIIVPFYNEELYIEKCIHSLLAQDYPEDAYEIILIDNASTDKSASIVQKYPRVKLLHEKKQGDYFARNHALNIARGSIIAFTDADCAVSENWLKSIEAAIADNGADLVLGKRVFPDSSPARLKIFELYENTKIEFIINKCPKNQFFGYTNNMAVRASVFKKIGRFSSLPVTADTEFVLKCAQAGFKISYSEGMLITHLEVTRTIQWLKKMKLYGAHNYPLKRKYNFETLTSYICLHLYDLCSKRYRFEWPKRIFAFIVLLTGNMFYMAGDTKAALIYRTGRLLAPLQKDPHRKAHAQI